MFWVTWKIFSSLGGMGFKTRLGDVPARKALGCPQHLRCLTHSYVTVVQSLSCLQLFKTPWTAACQAPLSSTLSQSLLKFMSTEPGVLSNHFILRCPLFLLPSIIPSIRVFSNELVLHIRWPKYWSFSFSPFNKYSASISFRFD